MMFVYRDEYYNPEDTERPGEADLIIAKHRNGPVGKRQPGVPRQAPQVRGPLPRRGRVRPRRATAPGSAMARTGLRRTTEGFCPEGTCDGSGWILGDDDVARPCACRKARISRAARATWAPACRGASCARRASTATRSATCTPRSSATSGEFCAEVEAQPRRRRGRWFEGDVGTGKTLLAMTISKAALEAGRSVAIYSVPRLLSEIKETYEAGLEALVHGPVRAAVPGRPAAPGRRRRGEADRVGARAALLGRQRALAGRALDRHDHEPERRRAARPGRRAHRVAAHRDLRRPVPIMGPDLRIQAPGRREPEDEDPDVRPPPTRLSRLDALCQD